LPEPRADCFFLQIDKNRLPKFSRVAKVPAFPLPSEQTMPTPAICLRLARRAALRRLATGLALAAGLAWGLGANAQLSPRNFPANAHYGLFKGSAWPFQPSMAIGHTVFGIAPGFSARGLLNERLSHMPAGEYAVAWSVDTQGQLLRVWILTQAENQALAVKYGRGGNTE